MTGFGIFASGLYSRLKAGDRALALFVCDLGSTAQLLPSVLEMCLLNPVSAFCAQVDKALLVRPAIDGMRDAFSGREICT